MGWITGIERLKVLWPGFISVKVNTAIGFLLSGAIILFSHNKEKKKTTELLISIFAIILFLSGLLTLLEYNFNYDFGIDELFFKDSPVTTGTLYPGRQTPLNSLFFLLFGLSFFPYLRRIKQPAATQIVNLLIATLAFMTFVTYSFSTDNAYENYSYLINSFQSSFSFIFLAFAAIFLRPQEGLMKIISSNTIGGKLFRKNFTFCLIVFLLLGWLIFKGEHAGLYISEFGISVFIISSVVVFTTLLFKTSLNLTAREKEQQETETALSASEEKYRTLIEQASDAILIVNESLQYVEVNNRATGLFGYSREEFLDLNVSDITVIKKDESPLRFSDLKGDTSLILERNFLCKDGTILPVEISGSKMVSGNYLTIVRDISERKKMERIISGERQVLEMIATGVEIGEILKTIIFNYEALAQHATCSILLLNDKRTKFKMVIGPGLPDAYNKMLVGFPVGPESGSCGTAAFRKEMVIVSDIDTDPLWAKYTMYLADFNLKACWSCPILDKNDDVLGTFAIYYNEIRSPDSDDIGLIERAVSQTKIALVRHYNEIIIKDNEEKFLKVFHNKGFAFAILNQDRQYIEVNESFENLIEYTRQDLIGKTSAEVGIDSLEFVQRRDELVIKLFTEGKIENVKIEFESRSGKEKAILMSVHGINLNNSQHWLLSMVDITEKNKTEKALIASEEKYRTLIDQASDAIFITDPLGKFLTVNKQTLKLTQLTEPEILKMSYYDFLFEDDVKKNPLHLTELAQGKTVVAERPLKRKNNTPVDVEITAKLLLNGNLLAFVKDITQRKKERQLVIDSEQRLVRAESMGNLGHGYFDLLNNYMHISAGLYKIFGVLPEDFSHTIDGLKSVIHPDDYMIMDNAVNTMFKDGEVEVEFRIVQQCGEIRNVLFKTVLTKNKSGVLVGSFTTALDITERKKAEKVILEKGTQLQSLSDNLPDSYMYQISLNSKGELKNIYLSKSIENLTGKTAEEIMQIPNYMVSQMLKEDQVKVVEAREYSYKNMTPTNLEVRCYNRHGEIRNMLIRAFPRRIGKDEVLWDGIYTDITELKRADAERQALLLRNEQTISSMLDGFILADEGGNIIEVNPAYCKMIGFRRDELLQKNINQIEYSLSADEVNRRIEEMVKHKSLKFETKHRRKDRKIIDLEVSVSIMVSDEKPLVAAFVRDITESRKAQLQIENYNTQLRHLTAHLQSIREEERRRIGREIHDDLGQQLTAIKMDVAWIDKKLPDESSLVKEKIKNIIALLDGSNISVRRILNELKPSILDEYGLLDAMDLQAKQFTQNTGIPVQVFCAESEIQLKESLATCIFRVFQESLTNITRHANATKVIVTIKVTDNKITVLIEDNGVGFDMSILQKKNSFGIIGMNERVRALAGFFEIVSTVDTGTKIKMVLPFKGYLQKEKTTAI